MKARTYFAQDENGVVYAFPSVLTRKKYLMYFKHSKVVSVKFARSVSFNTDFLPFNHPDKFKGCDMK